MSGHLTRRALGSGLMALAGLPSITRSAPATKPEPDPIFAAIRAHRDAVEAETVAISALARATRLGLGRTADLRAERKRRRKVRHNRRRDLRRETPTTEEGFRALAAYYAGLTPSPDPDDVAGRCRRDLDRARERTAA